MGRTSDARQRLMDAAYDLIWEYSYGAVTIEAICDRAAVKKGSFYYFFASKSDLAVAVVESWWIERELVLKEIFQKPAGPVERLREFLDFAAKRQIEFYHKSGQIMGCPIYGLGAEICNQESTLRQKIQAILDGYLGYFEDAIREAQQSGQIEGTDAARKAKTLSYYYAGALMQGRIENDPESMQHLSSDALKLIGVIETVPAPVFTDEISVKNAALPAQLVPLR